MRDLAHDLRKARPRQRFEARALFAAAAIAVLAGAFSSVGCATEQAFVWVQDLPLSDPQPGPPVIGPRDTIVVDVRNQASLSGEFPVGDGGDYRQPSLGPIQVAGKTAQ